MAYYAVTSESDELIPLSDLVFPTRIYFIVSDSNEGESVSFPIRYYDISNEIKSETFNLPFVYEMSGKYFYSFIQNAVASLQSEEETPTPTITPTIHNCATSPVTITVSSEYEASTNTRTHKYTTSDSNGNGGLFGCINVERGSTLTILVDGDQANLESHPIIITEFRNDGHHGTPRNDVTRIDLTEGQTEDHTYALTWVIPCDENINQYQYQCEHHSHMRGTINVTEECPTPTPEKTPTPEQTPTPTPEQTPTPTPEQTPTPTPEQTPTPTPEQTPTPTPEQTPTPTPEQTPTPTPEQTPTPTPKNQSSDCCEGLTRIPTNTAGVASVIFESIPGLTLCCSPHMEFTDQAPDLYEFGVKLDGGSVIGGIKIVARVGGISTDNFDSTVFVVEDADGNFYEADLGGLSGGEINFTPKNCGTVTIATDCCDGAVEIPTNTAGVASILMESTPGYILCCTPNLQFTDQAPDLYEFGVKLDGGSVMGAIKIVARVGGITTTNFTTTIFSVKDADGKCYSADLNGLTGGEIDFTSE